MKLEGSMIKKIRQEKGYKQSYFAHLLGVLQSHVSKIENNKAGISVPDLVEVSELLSCPITSFVC